MDLVHDVDAVLHPGGGIDSIVSQCAHMIHTVVGGGIQLQNIQKASVVDAEAGGTLIAGITVYGMLTVDRLGEDLGTGGLSGAAGTCEKVGVAQPALLDLTAQGLGDVILSHDVGKGLGTPFAVQCLIHGITSLRSYKYKKSTMKYSPQASAPNRHPRGTCRPA